MRFDENRIRTDASIINLIQYCSVDIVITVRGIPVYSTLVVAWVRLTRGLQTQVMTQSKYLSPRRGFSSA